MFSLIVVPEISEGWQIAMAKGSMASKNNPFEKAYPKSKSFESIRKISPFSPVKGLFGI